MAGRTRRCGAGTIQMSDSDHVAVYDTNGGSGRSDPREADDGMGTVSETADTADAESAGGTADGATGAATGLRERRRMA
ncbi:TetR family transcriptional regulator, partial [Clavibacter michiganensis]